MTAINARSYMNMKAKKQKFVFFCQVAANTLKVVKCLRDPRNQLVFAGFETETLPDEEPLFREGVKKVFKKIGFKNEEVILSLPTNYVTCRYLRVPTQDPAEIQKIVSLQAPLYLPYATHELITAYRIISTDAQGYSSIHAVIVPKDLVVRYVEIFDELKPARLTIIWSSYGLEYLFDYLRPQESDTVLIVDVDASQAELAIISSQKLLLSRYFKLPSDKTQWEKLFISEINKTKKAYFDEISKENINKIFVFCPPKMSPGFFETLSGSINMPMEILAANENLKLSRDLLDTFLNLDISFANLRGLAIKGEVEESLNLLPSDLKEIARQSLRKKSRNWAAVSVACILLISGLAVVRNFDNKMDYLDFLNVQLNEVENEVRPLKGLEKRFRLFSHRSDSQKSIVDIIYELHQLMLPEMTMISLQYEEGKQVVLNGEAGELDSVLDFVARLESSPVFKNLNIKIKHATKKVTSYGEKINFEITCAF